MVHNGSFLKLYIPTTLKFDRKAENPPLAPFTSVLHKEQSAATVCIRQHALDIKKDRKARIVKLSELRNRLPHYM